MNSTYPVKAYPVAALHNSIRDAVLEVKRKLQAPDAR